MTPVDIVYFPNPAEFRKWLQKHHAVEKQLWVGFHKKGSGKPSMTWPESVDEALCFGWIDGVRRSIDDESYTIRFTPRKATSNWSAVNIRSSGELAAGPDAARRGSPPSRRGRRTALGNLRLRAARALTSTDDDEAAAERGRLGVLPEPSPRPIGSMAYWVMSAKREETRLKRLDELIAASAAGKRL